MSSWEKGTAEAMRGLWEAGLTITFRDATHLDNRGNGFPNSQQRHNTLSQSLIATVSSGAQTCSRPDRAKSHTVVVSTNYQLQPSPVRIRSRSPPASRTHSLDIHRLEKQLEELRAKLNAPHDSNQGAGFSESQQCATRCQPRHSPSAPLRQPSPPDSPMRQFSSREMPRRLPSPRETPTRQPSPHLHHEVPSRQSPRAMRIREQTPEMPLSQNVSTPQHSSFGMPVRQLGGQQMMMAFDVPTWQPRPISTQGVRFSCQPAAQGIRETPPPSHRRRIHRDLYRKEDRSFANSLRRYADPAQRSFSAHLIRLLAHAQGNNGSKKTLPSKRVNSLTRHVPSSKWSNKKVQTYTRNRSQVIESVLGNWDVGHAKSKRRERSRRGPEVRSRSYSPRTTDVHYLSDVTRYVRDSFQQARRSNDGLCPGLMDRYNEHRKMYHHQEIANTPTTLTNETTKDKNDQASCSTDYKPLKRQSWADGCKMIDCKGKHGTGTGSFHIPIMNLKQMLCQICNQPRPCSCDLPPPCPCPQNKPTTYKDRLRSTSICQEIRRLYNQEPIYEACICPQEGEDEVNNITEEWLKLVPIHANYTSKDKAERDKIVKDLKSNLKLHLGMRESLKKDIAACMQSLPMWLPPKKQDQVVFIEDLSNKLLENILMIDVFGNKIRKWVETLSFVSDRQLNKDEIIDKLIRKFKDIAMTTKDLRNDLMSGARAELERLPITICACVEKEELAVKLVDAITSLSPETIDQLKHMDDFSSVRKKLALLDKVLVWVNGIPLDTSANIDREAIFNTLSVDIEDIIEQTEPGELWQAVKLAANTTLDLMPVQGGYTEQEIQAAKLADMLQSDMFGSVVTRWAKQIAFDHNSNVARDHFAYELTKKLQSTVESVEPEEVEEQMKTIICEVLNSMPASGSVSLKFAQAWKLANDLSKLNSKESDIKRIIKNWADSLPVQCSQATKRNVINNLANIIKYKADTVVPQDIWQAVKQDALADMGSLEIICSDDKREHYGEKLADQIVDHLFEELIRAWIRGVPFKPAAESYADDLVNTVQRLVQEKAAQEDVDRIIDYVKSEVNMILADELLECSPVEKAKIIDGLGDVIKNSPRLRDKISITIENWIKNSVPLNFPVSQDQINIFVRRVKQTLAASNPQEAWNAVKEVAVDELEKLHVDCLPTQMEALAEEIASILSQDNFKVIIKSWSKNIAFDPSSDVNIDNFATDLSNALKGAIGDSKVFDIDLDVLKNIIINALDEARVTSSYEEKNIEVEKLLDELQRILTKDQDFILLQVENWIQKVPFAPEKPVNKYKFIRYLVKQLKSKLESAPTKTKWYSLKEVVQAELSQFQVTGGQTKVDSLSHTLVQMILSSVQDNLVRNWVADLPFHDVIKVDKNEITEHLLRRINNILASTSASPQIYNTLKEAILEKLDKISVLCTVSQKNNLAIDLTEKILAIPKEPDQFTETLCGWINEIPFEAASPAEREKISENLVQKLKTKLEYVDSEEGRDVMKNEILKAVKAFNTKCNDTELEQSVNNLADKLIIDMFSDTVQKWVKNIKFRTESEVNNEELSNRFTEKLRPKFHSDVPNEVEVIKTIYNELVKMPIDHGLSVKDTYLKEQAQDLFDLLSKLPPEETEERKRKRTQSPKFAINVNDWLKGVSIHIDDKDNENIIKNTLEKLRTLRDQGADETTIKHELREDIENDVNKLLSGKQTDPQAKKNLARKLYNQVVDTLKTVTDEKKIDLIPKYKKCIEEWLSENPDIVMDKNKQEKFGQDLAEKIVDEKMSGGNKNRIKTKQLQSIRKTLDNVNSKIKNDLNLKKELADKLLHKIDNLIEFVPTEGKAGKREGIYRVAAVQTCTSGTLFKKNIYRKYNVSLLQDKKNDQKDNSSKHKSKSLKHHMKDNTDLLRELLSSISKPVYPLSEISESNYKLSQTLENKSSYNQIVQNDSHQNKNDIGTDYDDINEYKETLLDEKIIKQIANIFFNKFSIPSSSETYEMKQYVLKIIKKCVEEQVNNFDFLENKPVKFLDSTYMSNSEKALENKQRKLIETHVANWIKSIPELFDEPPAIEREIKMLIDALIKKMLKVDIQSLWNKETKRKLKNLILDTLDDVLECKGKQLDSETELMLANQLVDSLIIHGTDSKLNSLSMNVKKKFRDNTEQKSGNKISSESLLKEDDLIPLSQNPVDIFTRSQDDRLYNNSIKTKFISKISTDLNSLHNRKDESINSNGINKLAQEMCNKQTTTNIQHMNFSEKSKGIQSVTDISQDSTSKVKNCGTRSNIIDSNQNKYINRPSICIKQSSKSLFKYNGTKILLDDFQKKLASNFHEKRKIKRWLGELTRSQLSLLTRNLYNSDLIKERDSQLKKSKKVLSGNRNKQLDTTDDMNNKFVDQITIKNKGYDESLTSMTDIATTTSNTNFLKKILPEMVADKSANIILKQQQLNKQNSPLQFVRSQRHEYSQQTSNYPTNQAKSVALNKSKRHVFTSNSSKVFCFAESVAPNAEVSKEIDKATQEKIFRLITHNIEVMDTEEKEILRIQIIKILQKDAELPENEATSLADSILKFAKEQAKSAEGVQKNLLTLLRQEINRIIGDYPIKAENRDAVEEFLMDVEVGRLFEGKSYDDAKHDVLQILKNTGGLSHEDAVDMLSKLGGDYNQLLLQSHHNLMNKTSQDSQDYLLLSDEEDDVIVDSKEKKYLDALQGEILEWVARLADITPTVDDSTMKKHVKDLATKINHVKFKPDARDDIRTAIGHTLPFIYGNLDKAELKPLETSLLNTLMTKGYTNDTWDAIRDIDEDSTFKEIRRSSEVARYINELENKIEKWIDNLPIDNNVLANKRFKDTTIKELVKDINDRLKYLEQNPTIKTTEVQERKLLTETCHRWMQKFLDGVDLDTAMSRTGELIDAIRGIPIPKHIVDSEGKEHLDALEQEILDWQSSLPSHIKPIVDHNTMKTYMNDLDSFIQSHKGDPDAEDKTRAQIREMLKLTYGDLSEEELKRLESELFNKLAKGGLIGDTLEPNQDTSEAKRRRNSSQLLQYANGLENVIGKWVDNLPKDNNIHANKQAKDTVVKELTRDIIDREKYLKQNPTIKTTEAQERKLLTETCHRWMQKFLDGVDLDTAMSRTGELIDAIRGIPVPKHIVDSEGKEHLDALEQEILDWQSSLPSHIKPIVDDNTMKTYMNDLDSFIQSHKGDPDAEDKTRAQIRKMLKLTYGDLSEEELKRLESELFNKLAKGGLIGDTLESNQDTSEAKRRRNSSQLLQYANGLENVIGKWVDNLPKDNNIHADKQAKDTVVKELTRDIIDREKYLKQNPTIKTTEAQERKLLTETCHRWMQKFLDGVDLDTAMSRTGELIDAIRGIPVPKHIVDSEGKEHLDALEQEILDWQSSLPSHIKPIVDDNTMKTYMNDLDSFIQSHKGDPDAEDKTRAQIRKMLKLTYGDLSEEELKRLESELFNKLAKGGLIGNTLDPNQDTSEANKAKRRRNSSQLFQYANGLENVIGNWLDNLPIDENVLSDKQFRNTMIKDLAGDVMDRNTYLHDNPEIKSTPVQERDFLKDKCHIWMKKFLDGDDLKAAMDRSDELIEAIQDVPVPKLTTTSTSSLARGTDESNNALLKHNTLNWLKQSPMYLKASPEERNKMELGAVELAKGLNKTIASAKHNPGANLDKMMFDEIKKHLKSIMPEPDCKDEAILNATAENLSNYLKGQKDFQELTGLPSIPSVNLLALAVDNWMKPMPFETTSPQEEYQLDEAKNNMISRLKLAREQFHPSTPEHHQAIRDEGRKFLRSYLTDPHMRADNQYIEKQVGSLVKILDQVPLEQLNTNKSIKQYKSPAETLFNYVEDWVESIPVQGEAEKVRLIKQNLASKLINKIGEINMNPDIFNDYDLYQDSLSDEIDKLLLEVPENPELNKYLPAMKKEFISKLMDARQKMLDELAGKLYKQHLRDQISNSLPLPSSLALDEEVSLELLKDKVADAFINLRYGGCNDCEIINYKKKLSNELNRFCADIIQHYPCARFDVNKIKGDLHDALLNVSVPKDDSMKSEVEQARIRDLINDWMRLIPLRQETARDKLRRFKLAAVLAQNIHHYELEKQYNDFIDTEPKVKEEICKFMSKIPIRQDQEMFIPAMVNKLLEILNYTEQSRRFISSFPCQSKGAENICSPLVCISSKSKLNSNRTKNRGAPCKGPLVISPLTDFCSQTDIRGTTASKYCNQKTCTATPQFKDASSMTEAPYPFTPRVVVKEYIWDSPNSHSASQLQGFSTQGIQTLPPQFESSKRPSSSSRITFAEEETIATGSDMTTLDNSQQRSSWSSNRSAHAPPQACRNRSAPCQKGNAQHCAQIDPCPDPISSQHYHPEQGFQEAPRVSCNSKSAQPHNHLPQESYQTNRYCPYRQISGQQQLDQSQYSQYEIQSPCDSLPFSSQRIFDQKSHARSYCNQNPNTGQLSRYQLGIQTSRYDPSPWHSRQERYPQPQPSRFSLNSQKGSKCSCASSEREMPFKRAHPCPADEPSSDEYPTASPSRHNWRRPFGPGLNSKRGHLRKGPVLQSSRSRLESQVWNTSWTRRDRSPESRSPDKDESMCRARVWLSCKGKSNRFMDICEACGIACPHKRFY